jgi:hypothetical protein
LTGFYEPLLQNIRLASEKIIKTRSLAPAKKPPKKDLVYLSDFT